MIELNLLKRMTDLSRTHAMHVNLRPENNEHAPHLDVKLPLDHADFVELDLSKRLANLSMPHRCKAKG